MVDPGDFKDANQPADELLSKMRDMVFEGRDLTDEVKKLTKENTLEVRQKKTQKRLTIH